MVKFSLQMRVDITGFAHQKPSHWVFPLRERRKYKKNTEKIQAFNIILINKDYLCSVKIKKQNNIHT